MDLLFSKYASPFVLLDEMIFSNRLADFVDEIFNSENDKKIWEIYLACVANPYAEVTSFNEFKRKNTEPPSVEKIELEATVKESYNILQNFTPN